MHNLHTTAQLFWDLNFQFRGGHGPATIDIPIIWGCQLKYEKHEKFLMLQRLISACTKKVSRIFFLSKFDQIYDTENDQNLLMMSRRSKCMPVGGGVEGWKGTKLMMLLHSYH
jgi:hypothetical protein